MYKGPVCLDSFHMITPCDFTSSSSSTLLFCGFSLLPISTYALSMIRLFSSRNHSFFRSQFDYNLTRLSVKKRPLFFCTRGRNLSFSGVATAASSSPLLCFSSSTCSSFSSSSFSPMDNDKDSRSSAIEDFRYVPLVQYLQQVINAVDPDYCMAVTEQHPKTMFRCLMGYANDKALFEWALAQIQAKVQWQLTTAFVRQDLTALDPYPSPEEAPQFHEGIRMQLKKDPPFAYQPSEKYKQAHGLGPAKLFSYLARGRTYQGKFERLLQDVAPQLLDAYQEIVRERSELELMRMMVLQESQGVEPSDQEANPSRSQQAAPAVVWRDQLLEILDKEFGNKMHQQPENGGKQLGVQGEFELTRFLRKRIQGLRNCNDDIIKDHDFKNCAHTMVLSNVVVKPPEKQFSQRKQLNQSNKSVPYVIYSNVDLHGLTSEFDALVVEIVNMKDIDDDNDDNNHKNSDKAVRIVELWEAKASLHHISISDCLFKKVAAVQAILHHPEAYICFNSHGSKEVHEFLHESDQINGNKDDETLTFPLLTHDHQRDGDSIFMLWRLGIFGSDLLSPKASARRTQLVECESLLQRNPDIVLQALEKGWVPAPDVKPQLQVLLEEARRLQPLLVLRDVPLRTLPQL